MKKMQLIFITMALLLLSGCSSSPSNNEQTPNIAKEIPEVSIEYQTVDVSDISIAGAKRYAYKIVVTEEVTVEQLKEICDYLVETKKESRPYNAMAIYFYNRIEYMNEVPTMGYAMYAPYGKWEKAMEVETGYYENMAFEYSLLEKDWTLKLTDQEAEIWKAWIDLYDKRAQNEELPDEEKITKDIAATYELDTATIDEIMLKHSIWTFNNLDK
jgi:hypothetical protein